MFLMRRGSNEDAETPREFEIMKTNCFVLGFLVCIVAYRTGGAGLER